jgi:uncharacterized peroxidase-related enzyme
MEADMFLKTVQENEATGEVAQIYRREIGQRGFLMAATQCWTARPDLLPLYEDFSDGIRENFSLGMRGWRLITLIVAKSVPSTYCSHVYAKALVSELGSKEKVLAVQRDFRNAGLDAKEVAMLAYAEQIAVDASKVSEADLTELRRVGFSDVQICDIALCASFRCFVSRFFDATGATPEASFLDADEEFRLAMTVGRAL